MDVEIVRGRQWPDEVEALLAGLPDWFAIPEANRNYVEEARHLQTIAALAGGDVVGALVLKRHFPASAEIELLAVRADLHRQGVGRALVDAAVDDVRVERVRLLQVKTQGPSAEYEPYARTRAFYEGIGFFPLEEFLHLWPTDPCLVLVKPIDVPA